MYVYYFIFAFSACVLIQIVMQSMSGIDFLIRHRHIQYSTLCKSDFSI